MADTFVPVQYEDGTTIITAENLNDIQDELVRLRTEIPGLELSAQEAAEAAQAVQEAAEHGDFNGKPGPKGDPGVSLTVGTVTTGEPGTKASVKNRGTPSDPVLDFVIPQGPVGPTGGVTSVNGEAGAVKVTPASIGAQETLTGTAGQVVGFDETGKAVATDEYVKSVNGETGAVEVTAEGIGAQGILTGTAGQVVGFDEEGKAVPTDAYVKSVNGQTGAVEVTPEGIGAQETLTGTAGQVVGFDETGKAVATDEHVKSVNGETGAVEVTAEGIGAQGTLTGTAGQVVGFDEAGKAVATDAYVKSVNGQTGAVEIGGVNLLRQSLNPTAHPYGGGTLQKEYPVTVEEWHATDAIRYSGTSGSSNIAANIGNEPGTSLLSKPVCISMYVKNTGKSAVTIGRNTVVQVNSGETKYVVVQNPAMSNLLFQISTLAPSEDFDVTVWHMMFEYGTVATPWSPAPEDKQDTLAGAQGQIIGFDGEGKATPANIGGRNLVRKSSPTISSVGWKLFSAGTELTVEDGYVIATNFDGNYMMICTPFADNVALQEGIYTLSFDWFASDAEIGALEQYAYIFYDGGVSNISAGKFTGDGTIPSHVSLTFSVSASYATKNNWRVGIGFYSRGGTYKPSIKLHVKDVKLEKGTVATDWTPAPEDKQNVPVAFSVTLPVGSWANNQQTVQDARFLDGDQYVYDVDVHGLCVPWDGITITEGQMVVKVDIVPTANVTVDVIREEVANG